MIVLFTPLRYYYFAFVAFHVSVIHYIQGYAIGMALQTLCVSA